MQSVTVERVEDPDLSKILAHGERVLWSGSPGYGGRIFEMVDHERVFNLTALVGVLLMWTTVFFIEMDAHLNRSHATWVYSAITLVFLFLSLSNALDRQFVLLHLVYFVTDRRVIICRSGKNWRLRDGLYVLSLAHVSSFPYRLQPSKPLRSVVVGKMLSEDVVQPFSHGLTHAGHSPLHSMGPSTVTLD